MLREKYYEWKNWKGMVHTTWNPDGPGAIRIHLIPPRFSLWKFVPSVVILNGNQILPLNESWAILLTEFIRHLNEHGEKTMTEEELDELLDETCSEVQKVYPSASRERLMEDLDQMAGVFEDIARGREPKLKIGQMSIGEYAPYMKAPHRMDLMVSSMEKEGKWNCNQKCLHCYAAGQKYAGTKELTTQEWKKVIQVCRKAGIAQLTFTGGEPTMREDLPELIGEAKWFITRLNTNGIRLTKEYCKKLREAELDNVQITLYSNNRDIHNCLTGSKHFDQTVEGIKNAVSVGLSVNVNTPLCTQNQDYVETIKFLESLGVVYVTCSGLIPTGNAKTEASASMRLSKEEIARCVGDAAEFCFQNQMEITFTSPGWLSESFFQERGMETPSCGAALSNMAVTPDGKAVACQSCLDREILGDMLLDDWKKIWKNPKCRRYREYAAKMFKKCPLWEGEIHEAGE